MEQKDTYYLYGMHPVIEAVNAGRKIDKVLFKQGLEGQLFRSLLTQLQEKGIPFQFVPAERMGKFRDRNHQGVVAYLPMIDYAPFEEVLDRAMEEKEAPLFVLVDGVSDVRNLGAIVRTAECAGASAVILPAKGGAAINADGIKASAGALLRLPVCKMQNLRLPIFELQERGFQILAATEKSTDLIYDVDFTKPTAIVMGSEGKGISDSIMALCDVKAAIPMNGGVGSLNVSVAASIILFEAVRQRCR